MRRTIRGNQKTVYRRRELRKVMTPVENHLWLRLRYKQVAGIKFRRQHGIGPFIVDFFCPEIALAIEVDGDVHAQADQIVRDQEREAFLRNLGVDVVRFQNYDVLRNIDGVIEKIIGLAAARSTSPSPSLQRRGDGGRVETFLPFVRGGKVG
ncbi:MAG TPA: endonuclease domain-containing protein [Nitrospiria bacterium]